MTLIPGAIGTADLLARMRDAASAVEIMRAAKDKRRSLSAMLETLSPTDREEKGGLDAFSRLMREADIVTRSRPDLGVYADTYETFMDRGGRALFLEWGWRQYRAAQASQTRAPGVTADSLVGSLQRPYATDPNVRMDNFEPAVPLSEILAGSRGISGGNLQGAYLVEPTAAQKRWVRVGESGEIPKWVVKLGDRNITLYKFGKGLEFSYEVMRRESLDRISMMIQLMSVQAEVDKLAAVIDVIVNGDGNANTAATSYNLTTVDSSATPGTLTLKGWLAFLGKFENPYIATHALAQEAMALQVKLLNTGSANLPNGTVVIAGGAGLAPGIRPINQTLSPVIGLGETSDAPANKIVAIDRRVAVERVYEIGSEIEETERYVSRQAEAIYFTETEGFQVGNANGSKILDVAA